MGFLDNISKSLSQGIDRAKFEADKFQKVARFQGEIGELQKQIDAKRIEFGDRAIELYKAGKITSPTLGELIASIEALRTSVTLKEEELKTAQAETFVEPPPTPSAPQAQNVPVSVEPPTPPTPTYVAPSTAAPSTVTPATDKKTCPNCAFEMPVTALFCPSCGLRVGN